MVANATPTYKPPIRALRQLETLRAAYIDLASASPLTTVGIARRANIDPSVIYKWRMGVRTSADRPVLEAVATALGLCDRDRSRLLAAGGYMPWVWSPFLAQAAALEAMNTDDVETICDLYRDIFANLQRVYSAGRWIG